MFPHEATETPDPGYSGREFTEDQFIGAETTPPEISLPEILLPGPTVSEKSLIIMEESVNQDKAKLTYNQQPPQGSNPHDSYPLPRGPRPVNPQVVILEEPDEPINVNGKILTVRK